MSFLISCIFFYIILKMRLLFIFITFFIFKNSFELPNGVEVSLRREVYSDWFDIFYNSSALIPMVTFGGKIYYIGKYFSLTYMQSHLFCKLMHMHLVTLPSEVENEGVRNILHQSNITGDFWSSGTRILDGKSWIWMSTARKIEYVNWGPGQPNNKNDHCILLTKTHNQFIWNDKNCNCRHFFICEKPLDDISLYVSKKHESEIRKYYRTYFD